MSRLTLSALSQAGLQRCHQPSANKGQKVLLAERQLLISGGSKQCFMPEFTLMSALIHTVPARLLPGMAPPPALSPWMELAPGTIV